MAEPLEPRLNTTSPDSFLYQSGDAYSSVQPENSFESVLSDASGTLSTLSYLAGDGADFANLNNPSFGGTVVANAINNLGTAPGGGLSAGASLGAGGYGRVAFNGSGTPFNSGGGGIGGALFGGGRGTVDGFDSNNIRQSMLDEGMQNIVLMAEVQSASRTVDTMSNIVKARHDSNMATIRNIRN